MVIDQAQAAPIGGSARGYQELFHTPLAIPTMAEQLGDGRLFMHRQR